MISGATLSHSNDFGLSESWLVLDLKANYDYDNNNLRHDFLPHYLYFHLATVLGRCLFCFI